VYHRLSLGWLHDGCKFTSPSSASSTGPGPPGERSRLVHHWSEITRNRSRTAGGRDVNQQRGSLRHPRGPPDRQYPSACFPRAGQTGCAMVRKQCAFARILVAVMPQEPLGTIGEAWAIGNPQFCRTSFQSLRIKPGHQRALKRATDVRISLSTNSSKWRPKVPRNDVFSQRTLVRFRNLQHCRSPCMSEGRKTHLRYERRQRHRGGKTSQMRSFGIREIGHGNEPSLRRFYGAACKRARMADSVR
jgi:hypothetical protein